MDLRAHIVSRLLAGRPLPLQGRLLADTTRRGELVALDPDSGGELEASVDDRPAFILSTEREATDGHILRQHWDLGRGEEGGAGIPILWNHNADILLGQWQDVAVRDLDGPVLVGRAWLDPEDETARTRRRQIRAGLLRAVSVRWVAGAMVRRGELDPADPLYRAPEDDACGLPAEGYVMGSAEAPNLAIEGSLTPTPADGRAVAVARLHQRAASALSVPLDRAAPGDVDALLAVLAGDPRVRAWASTQIRAALEGEAGRALLRSVMGAGSPAAASPPAFPLLLSSLFRSPHA